MLHRSAMPIGVVVRACLLVAIARQLLPTQAQSLSSSQRQEILDAHNLARALTAHDERAIGIEKMEYDISLEDYTVDYMNDARCSTSHSGGPYGENIAWGTSMTLQGSIDIWYEEIEDYIDAGRPPIGGVSGVAHYTQMTWHSTVLVGCAMCIQSSGNEFIVVICNYHPRGNWIGEYPYDYNSGDQCVDDLCPGQSVCDCSMSDSDHGCLCASEAAGPSPDDPQATEPAGPSPDEPQGCVEDPAFSSGFGDCASYADPDDNAGHCVGDGVCSDCCSSCASECNGCVEDPTFSSRFGDCASYTTVNAGHCVGDGVCGDCCSSCASECNGEPDLCAGVVCPDPEQCHVAGSCSDGSCSNPRAPDGTACNDGDGVCTAGVCADTIRPGTGCVEDPTSGSVFGNCASYADPDDNAGYCVDDGVCGDCCSSCASECNGTPGCVEDPTFNGGHGVCATYLDPTDNAGYCVDDGVCGDCCSSCASECNGHCLAVKISGSEARRSLNQVYHHVGEFNGHPYYIGEDNGDYMVWVDDNGGDWRVQRELHSQRYVAHIRTSVDYPELITGVWRVIRKRGGSFIYDPDVQTSCV